MVSAVTKSDGGYRLRFCWILGVLWLLIFVCSTAMSGSVIGFVLNATQMVMLTIILLLHASLLYGWTGTAIFCVIGFAVGFLLEASSVASGFPFGTYVHHSPGPRAWGVPVQGMFIYMCYGWYAWVLARVICLESPNHLVGSARVGTPLIAAFILAGFDYPIDPILSTVFGLWTFEHPGGQFGVPLSNFAGWIFAGAVIFFPLSAIDSRFQPTSACHSRAYWFLPCAVWIAQAAQYPLLWMLAPPGSVNLGSRNFVIADIFEASFAASLFSLLFVGLVASIRVVQSVSLLPQRVKTSNDIR